MNAAVRVLACAFLGGLMPAQEPLWQVHGPLNHVRDYLAPFGDYDHDGYRDLIERVFPDITTSNYLEARILSGLHGGILWQGPVGGRTYVHVGDMNGDGSPEFAVLIPWVFLWGPGVPTQVQNVIQVWSPATNQMLWQVWGNHSGEFGFAMLGDLDTDGDGRPNFVTITSKNVESDLYVYNHRGHLLYTVPMLPYFVAISLASMGDMDGDNCDDFIVGCADATLTGTVLLISGRTGALLRVSQGLQPNDKTFEHATNLGDIDGDGVNDYAAFPWWSTHTARVVCWSGATGNVIRTWVQYADSVIATEDVDLDGVNDLVIGAEVQVQAGPGSPIYGRTAAVSGRDGTEIWRVENDGSLPWLPSMGWGQYVSGLGVQPGSPYPRIAWIDGTYWHPANNYNQALGRIRAFDTMRKGQGPVTGNPCASSGTPPWIGARDTANGARVTIAKALPSAFAWLNVALGNPTSYAGLPLPIALAPFGMPGCELHVGPDITFARTTGTTGLDRGYAAVDVNVHLAATLGTVVQAQWLVFDPATSAYAATAKHQLRLQ